MDTRLLPVDVDGFHWIKRGSVVAYTGDFEFHLEPVVQAHDLRSGDGPVGIALKRELVPLSRAIGKGRLWLTNDGRFSEVIGLEGETQFVAASSLLAFEPSIDHELMWLGAVGALAGGIMVVRLSGHGRFALGVQGESLVLPVTPEAPLSADPPAVIAWTGELWPELKTDFDAGSFVGHGGGQPIQMLFRGHGQVTVQARRQGDLTARVRGLLKSVLV